MPTHLLIDATNPCVEMKGCQFSLLSRRFTGHLSTEAHPRQNQMTILFCASFEQGHNSTVIASSREILISTFLIGREVPLSLSFYPHGAGIPSLLPNYSRIYGFRLRMCSLPLLSALKREDEKALIPRPLGIGFHTFIRGLSASVTRIWYASLFAEPRG